MQPKPLLLISSFTAVALALSAAPAHAEPGSADERFVRTSTTGPIGTTFSPRSLDGAKKVDVMVELADDPVAVVEAKSDAPLTSRERNAVKTKLRKAQDDLSGDIEADGGKVVAKLQSAYNGIRVRIAANKADDLAGLPGVVGVHALTPKTPSNAVSVRFLGVPQAWEATGKTGKGIKVGIIDTGIDYTHATFGGPGTEAAYADALANSSATLPEDSTLFGAAAPRVKGGHDFAGDDYDAEGVTGSATPAPDDNPLDCNGHGTHVAGTAGGGGVSADGTAYAGPYDSSIPGTDFKVGPGVAPEVELYALKVFGCSGSTDLSVQAIDWAVDHQLDVINLSLGAPFGQVDDPDAVAAANAVAAGVVVVASSGNEGGNPYLAGSPAVGQGVIGVAAVDSAESFPGAQLTLAGATVQAINANGATLPTGSLSVVVVPDQADTDDVNESLGCSVDSFTAAGITPGGNQLAVVTRGECARAAKAIFGQQAGAAAVLMLNTDPGFPPFEGEITSNPDDGQPFQVTIPFFGASSDDAEAIIAADGSEVSFSATTLANPTYRTVADFSSAGPSTTESGLSPNVAAPGVSIASAAVGTGNGAQIQSGTSMAAPHVAGVAALTVQAHPGWTASQIAAAVVGTADADGVAGYQVTQSGAGLVDAMQAINTQTVVTGDSYRAEAGRVQEATLSFGFDEFAKTYRDTRTITITNLSDRPVTYTLSSQASAQSRPATVSLGDRRVTVRAHGQVRVPVRLSVPADTIGSSLAGNDQFSFAQVSGRVLVSSDDGVLAVPYLLVPRAQAKVSAELRIDKRFSSLTAPEVAAVEDDSAATADDAATTPDDAATAPDDDATAPDDAATTPDATTPDAKGPKPGKPAPDPAAKGPKKPKPPVVLPSGFDLRLANRGGALSALADVYTWGLADKARDLPEGSVGSGYDLRAAGVQSFGDPDDPLLVFAINSHDRWSNAATIEFDVEIDTDRDGQSDYVVIGYDSGYLRNGEYNGLVESFILDAKTGDLFPSGYLAQAPTDSSTILLPVNASVLGLTAESGGFNYTVAAYSILGLGEDAFADWAAYDPFDKALSDSDQVMVARNRTASLTVSVNPDAFASQQPEGVMVVVLDNKSGAEEAKLLGIG